MPKSGVSQARELMNPKVIHTIETGEPGGAENILVQIANGLRDEYEPAGVVLEKGWTSTELERLKIPVVHLPLARSFDLSWALRLRDYIRKNNIRLIHAHEFTSNAYSLVAARLAGIPVICTVHGKNYYPERYYRRVAYRQAARFADAFIAVSGDLRDFLVSRVGIPRSRITVIHNGIDTAIFNRDNFDRRRLREALQIPDDAYVVIVVAALFEMKGHRDLIAALGMLKDAARKLCVLFVGDGPYKSRLQELAAAIDNGVSIRFLGFRNDIAELLAVSDLSVLPSYSEGLPVSVLEAMSSGMPVIATDVGGLREVIRDGENALLVPPAQPTVLAEKIGLCMRDRPLVERLARRARADVIDAFAIESMLDSYRKLYRKLIPGSG